jgi:hypothetical protein
LATAAHQRAQIEAQLLVELEELDLRAHHLWIDFVQAEHGTLGHHQIAGSEKDLAENLDQVFRAVAEHQAPGGQPVRSAMASRKAVQLASG